jgi:hypothetical protein
MLRQKFFVVKNSTCIMADRCSDDAQTRFSRCLAIRNCTIFGRQVVSYTLWLSIVCSLFVCIDRIEMISIREDLLENAVR